MQHKVIMERIRELAHSVLQANNIELVDILGRTVYKEDVGAFSGTYQKKLNINTCQKGIYFIKIRGSNGVVTKKIIYN